MTVEPRLAVVISTRGTPDVVETAASVLDSGQAAGEPLEVVVVWDGPEDPPPMPTGARLLNCYPVDLAHARNVGVEATAAPLIAFVDDDEVVDAGWAAAALELGSEDGILGPILPRDERGLPHCLFTGDEPEVYRDFETPPWEVGSGGNMAFRRAALEALGGFDVRLGAGSIGLSAEETDAFARLIASGGELYWHPGMVVYHPTKSEEERLASRYPYAYGMGRALSRPGSRKLIPRYLAAIGWAVRSLLRDRSAHKAKETWTTARGFVAGLAGGRKQWIAPEPERTRMPAAVAMELADGSLRPQPVPLRGDPHFMYEAPGGRLLHIYTNPSDRLTEAVESRRVLASAGFGRGVPTVAAAELGGGALWVLEERLDGAPPRNGRHLRAWLGSAVEWAVELGQATRGEPLARTGYWEFARSALSDQLDANGRSVLHAALDQLSERRATLAHGNLIPANLVVGPSGVGALGWEWTRSAALPGLDLLRLAVTARGDEPEASVLLELAAGQEPLSVSLLGPLGTVGIGVEDTAALAVCAIADWAHDERQARARLGRTPPPARYQELLSSTLPALAKLGRL